jgi:hypothetical protein
MQVLARFTRYVLVEAVEKSVDAQWEGNGCQGRLCNFDTFKKEAPRLADSSNDPRPTKLGMPVAELIAAWLSAWLWRQCGF